jgi:hypothetical protein
MAKQQNLSPKEYIRTKARSLPIYKCFVNKDWEEHSMANVTVIRRHVNGNCTAGIYLVDLLCLGIKDTALAFNEPEDEIMKSFGVHIHDMKEISYELAHNIIYAGYDFATNFDIKPHKDFELTKFILEEDTEAIPLIEIPTGEENGIPHLVVSKEYNYRPILQKLKEHAGEGNYFFTIADDPDDDSDIEEDEEMDDDEFEDDGFEVDEDLEDEMLDFDKVSTLRDEELTDALEASEGFLNQKIIAVEILWRKLEKEKPLVMLSPGLIRKEEMYKAFERSKSRWESSYEKSVPTLEELFEELKASFGASIDTYLNLIEKYRQDEYACVMIFTVIPLHEIIQNFQVFENKFRQFPKALQLNIVAYAALLRKKGTMYHLFYEAENVEEVYPGASVTGYDHKCFWLIKAFLALETKNTDDILLYHSLSRISGVGGHLKLLYATQMESWLNTTHNLHIN